MGSRPYGSLIEVNGLLYGMTYLGGAYGAGVIFSYDPVTTTYTDLLDFQNRIYPMGAYPMGSLIEVNGLLYGMTAGGGAGGVYGYGVIFSYNPATSTYTDLLDFDNGSDPMGASPSGSLIEVNGVLYGMTVGGGAYGAGVIFSYNPVTNTYTDLLNFNDGSDPMGAQPGGSLIEVNGILYGMTTAGGLYGFGVIFSYNPATYTYTDLLDFDNGSDPMGAYPKGSLIEVNGLLYGTTFLGGAHAYGVIFSYDPATHTYTDLLDFNNLNAPKGAKPYGSLIEVNGLLYGMTTEGGASGFGVIFSYDPATSTYTDLLDFNNSSAPMGAYPYGSLIEVNDLLYGMTYRGGANNYGVIFSYGPITTPLSSPTDLTGYQKKNDVGLEYELFNILNWKESPSSVAGYYVYRENVRIATLSASTFQYEDHNRQKGIQTLYSVTAFDVQSNESSAITIIVP